MKTHLAKQLMVALIALSSLAATAQQRIDLPGHRGARWLLPENTLAGFEAAMKLGVTTLELDVVATKDDVLVISHNPALNPDLTRDAQGQFLSTPTPLIHTISYEELSRYDVGRLNPATPYARTFNEQRPVNGQKIPRLQDLFDLVKSSANSTVKFAIETKVTPTHPEQTPSPERVVDLLLKQIKDNHLSERVQILSFDWRTLQHVQRLSPGTPTVYLTAQLPELDNLMIQSAQGSPWTAGFQYKQYRSVAQMIKAAGGTHWSSFWRELDAQKVREAQQLGIKVIAWTVNNKAAMNHMMDLGVDGLVTDRPDLAMEVLKQRNISW
ncbi:glycerophosphodiester phosphodiesterase [Rhodoferax sp. 4810]|nr:glycerophosphodiester phosphodiesterase [Rhodoferax jenense]